MEKQSPGNTFWLSSTDDHVAKLAAEKDRIRETLTREGLTYVRGGNIVKGGAVSTLSLDESVKKYGLKSVDIEIQRALTQIEQDPHAAAQYAGNVLEAVLKAYLDHKQKAYNTTDTLAELWKSAADVIGLRPADWDNKDLKRIASGLYSIVDGIAHLRNAKSGAHGRSEEQLRNITIKPRHARLAIHSAHTVCAYVLELFE
nr:abortive infection family protein [Acetobacter fabarum]